MTIIWTIAGILGAFVLAFGVYLVWVVCNLPELDEVQE